MKECKDLTDLTDPKQVAMFLVKHLHVFSDLFLLSTPKPKKCYRNDYAIVLSEGLVSRI